MKHPLFCLMAGLVDSTTSIDFLLIQTPFNPPMRVSFFLGRHASPRPAAYLNDQPDRFAVVSRGNIVYDAVHPRR